MIEHEWSPGNPRCLHCGTLAKHHSDKPQPCVPRHGRAEGMLPEIGPPRVSALDDIDMIHARIIELRADDRAALNRAPADEMTAVADFYDDSCCG